MYLIKFHPDSAQHPSPLSFTVHTVIREWSEDSEYFVNIPEHFVNNPKYFVNIPEHFLDHASATKYVCEILEIDTVEDSADS